MAPRVASKMRKRAKKSGTETKRSPTMRVSPLVSRLNARSGEHEAMSESSFLELFRCRWQEIARQFWPQTPREQLQSELARLDAELGRRQNRLLILRKRIEKLHHYLNRGEHRLESLTALVQQMPAGADVNAKLERLQRYIDHLRERLQECECRYARQLARLRQRKREWVELRERLLSGALPKSMDEESDPDYPF
jgi:chromosome segregation ATPase